MSQRPGVLVWGLEVHHCDMALDLALTLVYLEEPMEVGGSEASGRQDLRSLVEAKPEVREPGPHLKFTVDRDFAREHHKDCSDCPKMRTEKTAKG